jgi:hypothetical protein
MAAVKSWRVLDPPSSNGKLGTFSIEVTIGNNEADFFVLVYHYRIHPSVVNVWTQVKTLCNDGRCVPGNPRMRYYVKEPKVLAAANGVDADYWRVTCWNDAGELTNPYTGNWPPSGTGHCGPEERLRVTLDYGKDGTRSAVGCGTGKCFTIVGRAYPSGEPFSPGAATLRWEGSGQGLDQWAVVSGRGPGPGWQARDRLDTPDDGNSRFEERCGSPIDPADRRWELIGYLPNDLGYNERSGNLVGWEGGSGPEECETLYAAFGPQPELYAWFNSYSFGDGWEDWQTPN